MTVDRYGDFVVVQWLSAGALGWRDELYGAIESALAPRGIYEQRRLRPLGGSAPPEPATRVRGDEAPVELVVGDGACRFGVDVTAPLGVGLFLDMRLGWAAVAARAAGRRLLNLFSYTGAFSVHAAKAGASEVVAVDLAAKAHARARRNYELSGLDPAKLETIANDVVKTLDRFADRKRLFDIVVCDPPTFSHGPAGQFQVSRDLARLAAGCALVLAPGGLLVFATNSTKVSSAEVDRALAEGGAAAGADLRIIERVGLPPDFPVAPGFPEGNYLKVAIAARDLAGAADALVAEAPGLHFVDEVPDGPLDRLVEADAGVRDLAQRGHGRLVVAGDQWPPAVGELTRALGREHDQGETVVDPLQTIFDGDASQDDLQN